MLDALGEKSTWTLLSCAQEYSTAARPEIEIPHYHRPERMSEVGARLSAGKKPDNGRADRVKPVI
jgi:hypothetical protein